MNVEIIAVGDELLIGQVTDTNSGWIARQLNLMGWSSSNSATILSISIRNSFSLSTMRRIRSFSSLMSVFGRVSFTSI